MTIVLSDDDLRFLKYMEPYIGAHPSAARNRRTSGQSFARRMAAARRKAYALGLIVGDGYGPTDGTLALTPLGLLVRTAEILRRRRSVIDSVEAGDGHADHADHGEHHLLAAR